MINATIKGAKTLRRDIKREARRARYAENLAVRVEGFRLMRLLKKEIRQRSPGGRKFAPLSIIARKRLHRGRNEPLRRLALAVRYHITKRDPVEMHIGWVGPRVSKSWKYLSGVLQEGFTTPITPGMREYFAGYGGSMRNRRASRYFFLRREKTQFKTPARPIMVPFWSAHRRDAIENIRDNFRRKMRGERI